MSGLPQCSWAKYEVALRDIGERRGTGDPNTRPFLLALGLVDETVELTEQGVALFEAAFVHGDRLSAMAALSGVLAGYPPAMAILETFATSTSATRDNVMSLLRLRTPGARITNREVGSLLMLMDRAGLLEYTLASGAVRVVQHGRPSSALPACVHISPATPFGNGVRLAAVLRDCRGILYWFDKHFLPAALEAIWQRSTSGGLVDIRIMSLPPTDLSRGAFRDYRNLKRELSSSSTELSWRVVPSSAVRDAHDRWVISSESAWNVPNVGAIYSGQHSDIVRVPNHVELRGIFLKYWENGAEIAPPGPRAAGA